MKIFYLIAVIALSLTSYSAFSASTGTLNLSGTVDAATSITVTAESVATDLDLTTTQSDLKVASVNESNNSLAGYTVTLISANSGKLKNGSSAEVSYTATYNGSSVTLSSTAVQVTDQGSQSGPVSVDKDFDISYTGASAASLLAGSYTDTLTFEITAK